MDRSTRWRLCALVAGLGPGLTACAFSSPGGGKGGSGLGADGDDDGVETGAMSGDDDGVATAGDEPATTSDSGDAGGSVTGDTTGDEGPPMVGGAHVVFVDPSPIHLGDIDLASSVPLPPLTLRNDGDAAAMALAAGALQPPLSWAGGGFPGTGGTCGGELGPAQTCTVVLAPIAGDIGFAEQSLVVQYQDAGVSRQATTQITLAGIGATENLLQNGGFEQGPLDAAPMGWTVGAGSWQVRTDELSRGMYSVFAGSASTGDAVTLLQDVQLSSWASTLQSSSLGLSVDGFGRALSNDSDEWNVVLTQHDVDGNVVSEWTSGWVDTDDWAPFARSAVVHPDAHRIRIALQGVKNWGQLCSVWFDDVRVRLTYPPPP